MTSYYPSQQDIPIDSFPSLYSQYLQNQHQWITSLFTTATSTLETNIMSNILKTINEDKSNKQNIMMITLCQLAQKIHSNGTLIENILSNASDEKQQEHNHMQTHEYLTQILSTLNKKQNRKINAIETKIYDIESQLKSHTNILENIYDKINNDFIDPSANNKCPPDTQKIMNKLKQMDKKINIIKSKQMQSNKHSEEQMKTIDTLCIDNDEIKNKLSENSNKLQSISRQMRSISLMSKQISSVKIQSDSSYEQLSSIQTQISSIKTQSETEISSIAAQLFGLINNKLINNKSTSPCAQGTHITPQIFSISSKTSVPLPHKPSQITTHQNVTQPMKNTTTEFEFNFNDASSQPIISRSNDKPTDQNNTSQTPSKNAEIPKMSSNEPITSTFEFKFTDSFDSTQSQEQPPALSFEHNKINSTLTTQSETVTTKYDYKSETTNQPNASINPSTDPFNAKHIHTNPQITAEKPTANDLIIDKDSITDINSTKEAHKLKEKGNKLYKQKKFKKAIIQYKICQKLCPSDPTYFMNESAALLMMNKLIECEKCCMKAIQMTNEPQWLIKAYKRMVMIKEKQDNIMRAMEYYCKVLKLDPNSDVKEKVKKWAAKNKNSRTEAENNIKNKMEWKCLNCKRINIPMNVRCIICDYPADMKKSELNYITKESML